VPNPQIPRSIPIFQTAFLKDLKHSETPRGNRERSADFGISVKNFNIQRVIFRVRASFPISACRLYFPDNDPEVDADF
jgi:hypothetical protein